MHGNYIKEQSGKFRMDPKSFWQDFNGKRKSNILHPVIEFENKTASSSADKSNLFAKFFQTVYMNHSTDAELDSSIKHRNELNCKNLVINNEIVANVLDRMNLNKGSGHNGVSSLFLRECSEILSSPLNIIFRESLKTGQYPEQFKMGQITPIYKSGKRSDAKNYRSVNVLPNLAEVFERIIYGQLKLIITPKITKS